MKKIVVAEPFNLVLKGEYLSFTPGAHEVDDHIAEHGYVQNFLRKEPADAEGVIADEDKDATIVALVAKNAELQSALESAVTSVGRLNTQVTSAFLSIVDANAERDQARKEAEEAKLVLELANEQIAQLKAAAESVPPAETPTVDDASSPKGDNKKSQKK